MEGNMKRSARRRLGAGYDENEVVNVIDDDTLNTSGDSDKDSEVDPNILTSSDSDDLSSCDEALVVNKRPKLHVADRVRNSRTTSYVTATRLTTPSAQNASTPDLQTPPIQTEATPISPAALTASMLVNSATTPTPINQNDGNPRPNIQDVTTPLQLSYSDTDSSTAIQNETTPKENNRASVAAVQGYAAPLSDPLQPIESPIVAAATSTPINNMDVAEFTPNDSTGVRKRQRKIGTWKKTQKSKIYNSGTKKQHGEYKKRELGPRCGPCKRSECRNLSDYDRQIILDAFWSPTSDQKFRQSFIIAHTEQVEKRSAKVGAQRSRGNCINYFLTIGIKKQAVCQKFFLNTLGISSRMVLYNLKLTTNGVRTQPGPRKAPHNKTKDHVHKSVVDHINNFPKVESHYCHKSTKRMYLESHLNIRAMWRLYKYEKATNIATEPCYRQIFRTEFNLGFHKPSKDQCDTCDTFKKLGTQTPEQTTENESHLRRKQQAYDAKEFDKEVQNGKLAVTFDLQQVLTVPRIFAGSSYYKRKLNTYNLTFYELQTNEGHCYYWTEAEACRGANDIATAVVMYLTKIDASRKYSELVLFSDTCGGQNRNKIIITAILSFLKTAEHIKKVSQKYFESGHSHMECDSMHSAIENAVDNQKIELPSDYVRAMKAARKSRQPYVVTEICYNDFKDYAELNSRAMPKTAFNGIIKIHHIVYTVRRRGGECTLEWSEEIGGELKAVSYRKKGAPIDLRHVKTAYTSPPGIPEKKKRDLVSMLPHFTNQSLARIYYNSLPILNTDDGDDNDNVENE